MLKSGDIFCCSGKVFRCKLSSNTLGIPLQFFSDSFVHPECIKKYSKPFQISHTRIINWTHRSTDTKLFIRTTEQNLLVNTSLKTHQNYCSIPRTFELKYNCV